MLIVQNYLEKNPCYQQNKHITVKGLMLHSVGCACSKASRFLSTFNSPLANAMVHGFIDANSGTIYQTAPWDMRCWHSAGGDNGKAYDWMIGVEMCESEYIQYTGGATFKVLAYDKAKAHVMTTYNSAVELFAYLCHEYDLDPLADGVILSHREGHARGIASNHGDPEHLWSQVGLPLTMDIFRKDVAKKLEEEYMSIDDFIEQLTPEQAAKIYTKANSYIKDTPATYGEESLAKAKEKGIYVGDTNGNLMPNSPITRLQFAIVADRMGLLDK